MITILLSELLAYGFLREQFQGDCASAGWRRATKHIERDSRVESSGHGGRRAAVGSREGSIG